ncbi:MAG: hypothetical protein ACR2PL_13765 [Dehalococcoidia bacterium]
MAAVALGGVGVAGVAGFDDDEPLDARAGAAPPLEMVHEAGEDQAEQTYWVHAEMM